MTIAESADYLEDIATAGGGKSYTQTDAAGLKAALEDIFADVAETPTRPLSRQRSRSTLSTARAT